MLRVPNSLKFPVLFVRPRESSEAREGRLISFAFGLGGGLRDRFRGDHRRAEESSDVEAKCFELPVGIGGNASVGDCDCACADKPYRDVFRRTFLGGEILPV